ncbi:Uncharacterised protein [BD1-7 clade bacterium]|uniref:ASPIC/UnbV domain-containing protein n=1 Tax=BD1-7 clade bacterium TaxID=2029982 RepID=A0A5S9PUU4_9GAMM|nr:Uncharacterised protein [BD1-7 clade bacterium]
MFLVVSSGIDIVFALFQRLVCVLFFCMALPALCLEVNATANDAFSPVLQSIGELEGTSDPKCYATASRLEDFIYGTPLTDGARFAKIDYQKALIEALWREASIAAQQAGESTISRKRIRAYFLAVSNLQAMKNGDWVVKPEGSADSVLIVADIYRQYSSIAYSLRAILAVQQDSLLGDVLLLPLSDEALIDMQLFLDLYTLAVLHVADKAARDNDLYEIDQPLFAAAWNRLNNKTGARSSAVARMAGKATDAGSSFALTHKIIAEKISAYQAYNEISNKVFIRNLQVYFARMPWPSDTEQSDLFKKVYSEVMVGFALDLYAGAEKVAAQRQHTLIRVEDVKTYAEAFIPHSINEYEDATFFPRLPVSKQIMLESYDMDAFRDSGGHWRYLQWAMQDVNFGATKPLDPFSAELMAENIAQFGVLVLRVAGMAAKEQKHKTLQAQDLAHSVSFIQRRIDQNNQTEANVVAPPLLLSSADNATKSGGTKKFQWFDEVSENVGIEVEHRSSDWLSRLLRSLVMKDSKTGVLAIPPAFGGSGIAADDINNDGYVDLLVLSGRGNKLYLNTGAGEFKDITETAGINWLGSDNHPGEVRQPVIADFNNDGLQDIFITYVNAPHRLYQNIDGITFKDVTAKTNLGGEARVAGPATVFDFDNDGLLDLYIAYFGDYIHGVKPTLARKNVNGQANRLFKNHGNFVFTDVTLGSGTDNTGWGQALTHTDFDGDGLQDLIVGNDFGVNSYLRNLGGGKFKNVAEAMGTGKPSYTMGIALSDLNDDGMPDIYISNIVTMNKDQKYVLPSKDTPASFDPEKLAHMRVVEANDLFVSASSSALPAYTQSKSVGRGYSSTGWSWGADFLDFDNDGDDDLYVLNGMNEYAVYSDRAFDDKSGYHQRAEVYMPVSSKETNVFFVNENGKLSNRSKKSGLDVLVNSRSAAYLDYDNDGDLDIAVNNYHAPAMFFRNNAERFGNQSFSVRLAGDPKKHTNRDAIGAQIVATLSDGNKIWRQVSGSTAYLTSPSKEQHFGLGDKQEAEVLVIWPDGSKQSVGKLKAGQRYRIAQGDEPVKAGL